MERETIDLRNLKVVVLDEADMMLDMGFLDDVGKIIEECPKDRQTMLFSATMPDQIVELSRRYLKNPVKVFAEAFVDPRKLRQGYYEVYPDNLKFSLLVHLLKKEHPGMVMVFCNTRRNVDFVVENLKAQGIDSIAIHGGLTQNKRDFVMEQFHTKKVKVLVCTDVAARGLDIKGVSHVYNYDIPKEPKEHIHRAGRTARAGENGMVISIVSSRDSDNFRNIFRENDFKISEMKMPFVQRVRIIRREQRRDFGDRGSFRGGFGDERRGGSGGFREGGRSERSDDRRGERMERRSYHEDEKDDKPQEIHRGRARPKIHVRDIWRGPMKKKK